MKKPRLLCISTFIFMVSFIHAESRKKTIVFFGDSLTAGYGIAEGDAYPARIQELIRQDGLNWKVVNAGISGDTAKGGLERLDWIIQARPALVFVALGANDGLRGLDLKSTQKNLDSIIRRLKGAGIEVILAGIRIPTNYGTAYTQQFKMLFPKLAEKHKIPFFPFLLEGVAMKTEFHLADGLHPNAQGHQVMADHIYRFLKPILR